MAGTGIALLVLPLFGVQLRRAGNLGPQGAMIVGGVLFAIGAISLASASLIRVKPARKRKVSRRSVAAVHSADAIDDEPESGNVEIVNPGEGAAKIVLWAIIIAMLAVPGILLGLPLLLLILFVAFAYWWVSIPLVLGVVALTIFWRRREREATTGMKTTKRRARFCAGDAAWPRHALVSERRSASGTRLLFP